jgi:dolichol-phosphate mannosyltransferase
MESRPTTLPTHSFQVSVVVPFRDEKDNLGLLVSEIERALQASNAEKFEIILVDDFSSDGGAASVKQEYTRVVQLLAPRGQSAAIWRGIEEASSRWIVTLDADLQNDPADIPAMLQLAREGDYDLVCGWRQNVQESSIRKISSHVANHVRRAVFGDPAHDTGCTLKVMKSSFAKRLPNWNGMHRFIPTYAAIWGLRQTEIPVRHRPRLHGESKTRQLSRACAATRDLFFMLSEKRRALHALQARKGF